ncbi:MAG: hypothetical protein ACFCD0_03045 [Gemmataceae bacterium]
MSTRVELDREDVYEGRLPDICIVCGDHADDEVRKSFHWTPPWTAVLILVGLLPYVVVAAILSKRMTVYAPVCHFHRGHWRSRSLLVWLGLLFFLVSGVSSAVLIAVLEDQGPPGGNDALYGMVCFGNIILLLAWLIWVVIYQNSAVRPAEITDFEITLKNVSPEFSDALRGGGRPRRRGRLRYDHDDDDYDYDDYDDYDRRAPRRGYDGEHDDDYGSSDQYRDRGRY